MDALTKVCTLLEKQGFTTLQKVSSQDFTLMYWTPRFQQDARRLANKDDLASVSAKAKKLQKDGLTVISGLKFCTFPLRGRSGLFELRHNGTRLYGSRVYGCATSEVVVMTGAEDKDGKSKADPKLLDICEQTHLDLMDKVSVLLAASNNDIARQRDKKDATKRKVR